MNILCTSLEIGFQVDFNRPLGGHPGTDHNPLRLAVQPVFSFILPLSNLYLISEKVTEDSVESLPKIKTNNIHCSALVHQATRLFVEAVKVRQA